ncbi:MAG: dolichyl-diphosphooligosaccharide--protein glycosyltransferase subunit STT3 [Helicobacteraceae bacterium]|jgi:dolichyl-diphosphooligosaccharide--protein glycosyltransferase/undecaprenyl-diphosphooligosaccharide--protein glycosyltransferase|nr:dolichyl-diphosphooligosaccharide--protein glycosyltransferase subunit STT3 [Helicobacteraceae bacterium]
MQLTQKPPLFDITEDRASFKTACSLILLAFIFSFAIRMIWVFQMQGESIFPLLSWNDQFMINTNDGYYWAEGARDILEGNETKYPTSPVHYGAPIITAFIAKLLPFLSFETLIFYLPAILSSLLVIPLTLIGRAFKQTYAGFAAALIASIAHSYYNRTMIGYYDDDMLLIVLPVTTLYALIMGIYTRKSPYLLLTPFFAFLSVWYYANSQIIIWAIAVLLLAYTLAFHRKEIYCYKMLTFLLLALASVPVWSMFGRGGIALFLVFVAWAAIFTLFERLGENAKFVVFAFLPLVALLAFFLSGIAEHVWWQLSGYVIRERVDVVGSDLKLHFQSVAQTVSEAKPIDFFTFANRISGHWITFLFACVGTTMLMIRHRAMLLALPFVGMGFMAYGIPSLISGGGLRFTIYAVPVLALGVSYFVFWAAVRLAETRLLKTAQSKTVVIVVCIAAILLPNIRHIIDYKMPSVFYSYEVDAIDRLGQTIKQQKDYAVTWWDYGYPLRFYSRIWTLIDGGKHAGDVNYMPSYILSATSQKAAARLARIAVEYDYRQINGEIPADKPLFEEILADYNASSAKGFLNDLSYLDDFRLPEKTRNIYLVLPFRMSDIFSTIISFSSIDPDTGIKLPSPFFLSTDVRPGSRSDSAMELVHIPYRFLVDKTRGVLSGSGLNQSIKYIISVGVADGIRKYQQINKNGHISLLDFEEVGKVWIVDDTIMNSTFIRLFVFGYYDNNLFEPTIITPFMKIYRLKI